MEEFEEFEEFKERNQEPEPRKSGGVRSDRHLLELLGLLELLELLSLPCSSNGFRGENARGQRRYTESRIHKVEQGLESDRERTNAHPAHCVVLLLN